MSRAFPSRALALAAVVAAALALAPSPGWALDPAKELGDGTVEVWGLRDGLSGTMVRALAQTPDGYLWIAAFGGIARYDGARIIRLEIEPPMDTGGIAADPRGMLFIAPRRGPVLCASRGTLVPCSPAPPTLPADTRNLALNRDRQGTIWLSNDAGAFAVNGRPKRVFGTPPEAAMRLPDPGGEMAVVARDSGGRLFIGTSAGLMVESPSPEGVRFLPYQIPGEPARPPAARGEPSAEASASAPGDGGRLPGPVRAIVESQAGPLWVLNDDTLYRVEGERVLPHKLPPGVVVGSQGQAIEDRDGNLWLATQVGLLRFREGRFTHYTKAHGLPDDDVTAVLEDREGSLWVGTRSGSIAQFTDRTVSVKRGPPGITGESVESVCEDPTGAMWFGTRLGLHRWKDGVERVYTRAHGLPGERVFATYPGRNGEVWIGTSAGLAVFRDGRLSTPYPLEVSVFSLFMDQAGVLWIGTSDGLARLHQGRLQLVPVEPGLQPGQVRGIQEDPAGRLWVTSAQGGLMQVVKGRLSRVAGIGDIARADRGISRDARGTLWFGAGTSLVRLRDGRFREFTAAHGLPRDWLFQVLADDQGFLWFGTSRTISRVPLRDLEEVADGQRTRVAVTTFDNTDTRREIAARRSRTPGVWRGRDGRLWFATLRGVVVIDPLQVRINQLPPPVVIEKAVVDGRPAEPGRPNRFPPGPGNIELSYAGVTLLEPRKTLHRYKLEGFDKDWVEAGTRRVAYYANIPAGSYVFRVQASNADGIWNQAGAVLELHIAPHFYRTVWFYALAALSLGLLAFVLYRARLARLRGEYLAVFAERNRVARELHDSLLQGMSAVALELENIRHQLPAAAASSAERLEVVENALTTSLEETRRFVWNLREQQHGAGDLGLALSRLAGRLTEGKQVTCKVKVTGKPVHLSHDAQGTLFRVAQEALTNALKHAEARRIDLELQYLGERVVLNVRDDGQGFTLAEVQGPRERHFGILGMQERARRLGAELEIDSRPRQGTLVRLALPLSPRRTADV